MVHAGYHLTIKRATSDELPDPPRWVCRNSESGVRNPLSWYFGRIAKRSNSLQTLALQNQVTAFGPKSI